MFLKIQFLEGQKRKNYLKNILLRLFMFLVLGYFVLLMAILMLLMGVEQYHMLGIFGRRDLLEIQ